MCHGGEGNGSRKHQPPLSQADKCAAESVPGAGESRRAPEGELGGLTGSGAGGSGLEDQKIEFYEGPHGCS